MESSKLGHYQYFLRFFQILPNAIFNLNRSEQTKLMYKLNKYLHYFYEQPLFQIQLAPKYH